MSLRDQILKKRAALKGRLATMNVGDRLEIPSTGATAEVVTGVYTDNAANRKLGRVGQTYKKLSIVSNSQKGQRGLMVDGSPINRERKTISTSEAQRAFNAYWNRKIREGKAKGPNFERAAKAARARDIAFGEPDKLVNDRRYRQRGRSPGRDAAGKFLNKSRLVGPGRSEYQGVDFGAKRYNVARPSEDVIAKLVANARSRLAADIASNKRKAGDPAVRERARLGRAQAANRRKAEFVTRVNAAEQMGGYGRRF